MKILIVDDSVLDKKLLISTLKKLNVENDFLQASDGEEGINILSANYTDIALVLLDWQMPKVDGIEFMKAMLKVPEVSTIPIVMITASSSEENKIHAREVNPNLAGYIVKPYNKETLLRVISPYVTINNGQQQ